MVDSLIYDKAMYHLSGEFPDDVDPDQAFVPTGFFVAWLAMKDLIADEVLEDFRMPFEDLRQRKTLPSSFYKSLGGVFESGLLKEIGRRFTEAYFDFDTGAYLDDLDEVLAGNLTTLFHVPDTWSNFDNLAQRIDQRFEHWKSSN